MTSNARYNAIIILHSTDSRARASILVLDPLRRSIIQSRQSQPNMAWCIKRVICEVAAYMPAIEYRTALSPDWSTSALNLLSGSLSNAFGLSNSA